MKLKIVEALNASQAIMQFGQTDLPFQMSLDVAKIAKELQNVAQEYDKRRLALVEELGEKDEETGHTNVTPANQKAFQDRIDQIVEEVITIKVKPINPDALPEDYSVPPNVLIHLQWLFC